MDETAIQDLIKSLQSEVSTLRSETAQAIKRLECLEASDRLQTNHLKWTRRVQIGCVLTLAIGGWLAFGNLKPEQRDQLQSLAITLIITGGTTLIGAEFATPKSQAPTESSTPSA